MATSIQKAVKSESNASIVLLADKKTKWLSYNLSEKEVAYIQTKLKADERLIVINQFDRIIFVLIPKDKKERFTQLEDLRASGNKICSALNAHKQTGVIIEDVLNDTEAALALAEGIALSNYQFLKYRGEAAKEKNSLQTIAINSKKLDKKDLERLQITVEATTMARTLVNEPQSYLTAPKLAEEIQKMGDTAGFHVEVLNKTKIEALKMGGLLAVNKGSQTPPTFTIMEYKPRGAVNKKPLVLVGKGVVYDTGGLSLKPTPNSMDSMKCDMAGAAAVACAIYAVAKAKLKYHVVGLVPATDNRPGENAYTPGDVIAMYDGKTVEVLNTDAEGRMLLADALAYAKKYKPELVLDFATLTGAAAAAIGQYGIVCMGTADEKTKSKLKKSGHNVYERLVEFPFWDEYKNLIKSDLADMKNIGGPVAGAITAGKFLEYYTDYPWMHFDIAGPAFINNNDSYRGKNGTGVGVRLLFDFILNATK
ncbi:MAG: leucyl aminopeptidase [Bacteroidia bacterium]|nr:leucyl aminopeptidase [Bacteroidia bacterium]